MNEAFIARPCYERKNRASRYGDPEPLQPHSRQGEFVRENTRLTTTLHRDDRSDGGSVIELRFGNGFRLLVVDDDDGIRDVLADVFAECGFAVDAAEDLRRARERVDARPYDLIIVDKNLPDGSGLELARYLGERQADCEIVLITAHGTAESAFEAFELGLADVVPKPFEDLDEIRRRVHKALERLASARRARSTRVVSRSTPSSPSATPESERRLRFFVEMRVRFILIDGSLTGAAFVSQISNTDIFVESDKPLPLGACARFRLYLPQVGAMDIRGVVRRHGDGQSMLGMRIEFTELAPDQVEMIDHYLAPRRKTLSFVEAGSEATATDAGEGPTLAERFTPEALRLFLGMHGGKVLDFLETLDTATVQAILDADRAGYTDLTASEPGKIPAPFETLEPALFDPENANPEDLPFVVGSSLATPAEPTNDEERLRAKYRLSDEILDDTVRQKYAIDDSMFDDEPPGARPPALPPPSQPAAGLLSKIGSSADQRTAFATELRRRGEDALSRGLVFKAASDLALAVAFDSQDASLNALHDRVRGQASSARAEDLYRQGLQQTALGDVVAASKLLTSAARLVPEVKYVIAAARVLLQSKGEEASADCRTLLRDAIARDGQNADLHVLNGKAAEQSGFPKAALRSYQRALELKPDHEGAKELLARLS